MKESYVVGDKLFGKHVVPKFFQWCKKKGYDLKDIEKFTPKDKQKIILRYKWCTEDDNSAGSCEQTRRDVLEFFTNIPPISTADKHWLKNALSWEYEINKIKGHFGLISQDEMEAIETKHKELENATK